MSAGLAIDKRTADAGGVVSAVLKAAHAYVDRLDWAVFPCFGKAPAQSEKAGGHGWLSATRDHEEIDRLWRFYAADSIAVACKTSGFFAVDVDPRDGGDDTLRDIETAHEPLPPTVRQITGSGGEHILFKAPSDDWKPVGSLGAGIQIKWRGYIIAAPSPHEKTKPPVCLERGRAPSRRAGRGSAWVAGCAGVRSEDRRTDRLGYGRDPRRADR